MSDFFLITVLVSGSRCQLSALTFHSSEPLTAAPAVRPELPLKKSDFVKHCCQKIVWRDFATPLLSNGFSQDPTAFWTLVVCFLKPNSRNFSKVVNIPFYLDDAGNPGFVTSPLQH